MSLTEIWKKQGEKRGSIRTVMSLYERGLLKAGPAIEQLKDFVRQGIALEEGVNDALRKIASKVRPARRKK